MINNISELAKMALSDKKVIKDYQIVGVTFEGRQDVLSQFYKKYKVGKQYNVVLMPENDNPYDKNAISVALEIDDSYQCVGYISKNDNVALRKDFDCIYDTRLKSIGIGSNGNIGLSIRVYFDFSKDNNLNGDNDDEVVSNNLNASIGDKSSGYLALPGSNGNLGIIVEPAELSNELSANVKLDDLIKINDMLPVAAWSTGSIGSVNVDGIEVDVDKLIECYKNANKGAKQ